MFQKCKKFRNLLFKKTCWQALARAQRELKGKFEIFILSFKKRKRNRELIFFVNRNRIFQINEKGCFHPFFGVG